jgi:hypothetical protein
MVSPQSHPGEIRVFKTMWGKAVVGATLIAVIGLVVAGCGGGSSTASEHELALAERHARQVKTEKEKERRLERKLERLERENKEAKKRRQQKLKKQQKAREEAHVAPPAESSSAPTTPSTPSGTDCGGGVIAGPETSCGFALETRDEYEREIGAGSGSIEAYSEANEQWYPMYCTEGAEHECSGAISATVYWP